MDKSFFMKIAEIQPSQLYLSSTKIEEVKSKYVSIDPDHIDAVPIKKLKDEIIFTDGHTRAYVLWAQGYQKIKVVWEDEELDWEAYQVCVQWCKEEGVFSIAHLKHKIIDNDSYQIQWIKRCEDMISDLEKKRK